MAKQKDISPRLIFFLLRHLVYIFPKTKPPPNDFSYRIKGGGVFFSDPAISLLRGGLLVFFRDCLRLFLDRPKMFDDRVVTAPDYIADGFAVIAL